MAKATVSYLRDHADRLLDRVEAGESVTITRDGKPVAQLAPLPVRPMSASALVERFSHLPALEPQRFRSDVDQTVDGQL